MTLRKTGKHEKIVADVFDAIRQGHLRPGDRLLPFAELCRQYGVTQFILSRAMDELQSAGMIVREHRRGVFVAPNPGQGTSSATAGTADSSSQNANAVEPTSMDLSARHSVLTSLLQFNPHASEANISLFVTDGYPAQLALWRESLAEFEQAHPRCQIELDHVQEDYADSWRRAAAADIVVAPPAVLRALRPAHFLPVDDLTVFGLEPSALHDCVGRYVEQRSPLVGVPLALVPNLLFFDGEAARRLDIDTLPWNSLTQFLNELAERIGSAPVEERLPLSCGGLSRMLTLDGGVSLAADLTIELHSNRARRLLEAAHALSALTGPAQALSWDAFCSAPSHLTGAASGLYLSLFLKQHARRGWEARPLPAAPDATGPETPVLCCGLRRDTPWIPECVSLVHHLCGDRTQRRLASLGHCVPIRVEAAFDSEPAPRYPIPIRSMRQVVDQGCLCWDETAENQAFMAALNRLGIAAESNGFPVQETLHRIEALHHRYKQGLQRESQSKEKPHAQLPCGSNTPANRTPG